MRSLSVVVDPPGFDQNLRLSEGEEDLAIEQLVAELAVEALAVAVFPRTAGLDVGGLRPNLADPFSQAGRDELWAMVVACSP